MPPEILDSCVSKNVAKGMSKSRAFAICTSSLQDAGILKQGSQDLTDKGRKRSNTLSAMSREK